ncbi:unnamed protein product [Larinioides sclopetarius]|uniref:Uncharacterized protein n=1 Tax=Larinioides sclopetarius TaxID=280406 RepID=A0AAV1Z9E2_9ARAC
MGAKLESGMCGSLRIVSGAGRERDIYWLYNPKPIPMAIFWIFVGSSLPVVTAFLDSNPSTIDSICPG